MILTEIHDALVGIEDADSIFYGTASELPKDKPWDYIVFSRDVLDRKQNKSGYADVVNVAIVREEFIPDGLAEKVIEAIEALPGFRLKEGSHKYWYAVKPQTHATVEQLVLQFTHSRKS